MQYGESNLDSDTGGCESNFSTLCRETDLSQENIWQVRVFLDRILQSELAELHSLDYASIKSAINALARLADKMQP